MKVLTDNKYYGQIADIVREQTGTNNTYKPSQMVNTLKDLFYEEVEGVPPITFQGIGENLLDYRIDGASSGVGDKTNNLFDGIFLHRSVAGNAVGTDDVNRRSIAIDISNYNNGEKITFSRHTGLGSVFQMYQISSIQTGGRLNNEDVVTGNSNTLLATKTITNVNEYPYLMIFLNGANNPIEDEELIASKIMINVGSTALPYEPYGYKVPVVCGGITTNIYLDKPIYAKANIPSEYTEVEYIESTGTQYINTNIIPTNTTGVEAKITICNDNNRDNVFMGCRDTANGDNRYWIDVDWTGTDTLIFGFNNNTSANERYSLKGSDVGKSFIISMNYMNDRTGKINGITYDTSISSKKLVSISKPIYIFAGNRSGNAAYQYSGKLYNFKITDGTNVIRNFVPCYRNSDNVAGLYDLVNNVFYTNQGTGNFIVGPIKENESISLSDTNVNIPTIRGTNVLTVDTTVQPSKVYVKVRKESSYEKAMREMYEETKAELDEYKAQQ